VAVAREAAALYFEVIACFDPTVTVEEERLAAIRAELRRSDYRAAGALIPTDVLRKFAFAGTAEDVPDQAAEIIDGGAYRVEFNTHSVLRPELGSGSCVSRLCRACGRCSAESRPNSPVPWASWTSSLEQSLRRSPAEPRHCAACGRQAAGSAAGVRRVGGSQGNRRMPSRRQL
jgi:hypothetical protein